MAPVKPRICLNMIVKDEAHCISETLTSIAPYIQYYVISDTGSTDNTKEVITEFFKKRNIPGEIFDDKWRDFGHNRTLALQHALNKSEYIWVIDADDLIVGTIMLPTKMTHDAYTLKFGKQFTYRRTQIFRNSKKLDWAYIGVLHEYSEATGVTTTNVGDLEGDYYIDSRRIGARSKDPDKYKKDALKFEDEIRKHPKSKLNSRYWFYCGQSWWDYGNYEKSMAAYNERIKCGGWWEEVYESMFKIARIKLILEYSEAEIIQGFVDTYNKYPQHAEPLYSLMEYLNKMKRYDEAYKWGSIAVNIPFPKECKLFVFAENYSYGIPEQLAIASYNTGRIGEALTHYTNILKKTDIPADVRSRVKQQHTMIQLKLEVQTAPVCVIYTGDEFVDESSDMWKFLDLIPTWRTYIIGNRISPKKLSTCESIRLMDTATLSVFALNNKIDILIIYGNLSWFLTNTVKASRTVFWQISDTFNFNHDNMIFACYDEDILQNILRRVDIILTNDQLSDSYFIEPGTVHLYSSVGQGELLAVQEKRPPCKIKVLKNRGLNKPNYPTALQRQLAEIPMDKCTVLTAMNMLRKYSDAVPLQSAYALYEQAMLHITNNKQSNAKILFEKALSLTTPNTPFNDLIRADYITRFLTSSEAFDECTQILINNRIPEEHRERIEDLRNMLIPAFKDSLTVHTPIMLETRSPVKTMFSVTTCKRLDLFEKTMNSFLACCLDRDKIDLWLCVDDNSSESDRKKMQELYPWMTFVFKTPEQKKHFNSMNIIRNRALQENAEYLVHIEDDFHFVEKRNYVQDAQTILEQSSTLGQVAFNRNYMEVEPHLRRIGGGKLYNDKVRYLVHEHIDNSTPEYQEFMKRHNHRLNSAYWPHFTFRPSMLRVDMLRKVGEFYNTDHFELEYAKEYNMLGYQTAFFDTFASIHIGKKTWETGNNSYTLNNTSQFGSSTTTCIRVLSSEESRWFALKHDLTSTGYDVKRIEPEKLTNLDSYSYLKTSLATAKLLEVGVAHSKLWSAADYMVVMTDNVTLVDGFSDRLKELINTMTHDIVVISSGDQLLTKAVTTDGAAYIITRKGGELLTKLFSQQEFVSIQTFIKSVPDLWHIKLLSAPEEKVQQITSYPGWKFIRGMDSHGNDDSHQQYMSVDELIEYVDNHKSTVGFNTLGWVKKRLNDELCGLWGARNLDDGLYVKNDRVDIADQVNQMKQRIANRKDTLDLTFSVTTCKRWSHFKNTMDNFLVKCKDADKIRTWLCIDDNSSKADRANMQREYPFFDFIFKPIAEKGHPVSMNIWMKKIETKYVLHFEDDWRCSRDFTVNELTTRLTNTDQIIFVPKGRISDYAKLEFDDEPELEYIEYKYNKDHTMKPALNRDYDKDRGVVLSKVKTDMYWWWPGFSLNPSIMNFEKLRGLEFSLSLRLELFEYDFATQCLEQRGWRCAMTDLELVHTGDISSYSLNNTKRYYDA